MVSRPPLNTPPLANDYPRPSFQRTASTSSQSSMPVPPLKKRPSAFTLPDPLAPIPPPIPSPASQSDYPSTSRSRSAALDNHPRSSRKSNSRPSTANSRASREDVTPWEYQSSPFETIPSSSSPIDDKFDKNPQTTLKSKSSSVKSKPPSIKSAQHQPSLRSRTSSTPTGLVEEVTPWELYPPIPENNTKYHMPRETMVDYIASPNSPAPITATGYVEDVTPWELVSPPPPLPTLSSQDSFSKSFSLSQSHLASVDETSTLLSYDSGSYHNRRIPSPTPPSLHQSHVSGTSSQEQKVVKTGPTEDVTPWELEPGPTHIATLNDCEEARVSPSTRMRSSLSLAQVEEVTPWELHPGPSVLPLDDIAKESKVSKVGSSAVKKKNSNSSNTFVSSSGKAFSDLSFVRGRKHGTKSSKSRHTNDSHILSRQRTHSPIQSEPEQADNHGDGAHRRSLSRVAEPTSAQRSTVKTSNLPAGTLSSPITSPITPVTPAMTALASSSKSQFNMSTADRKILSQLEFFKDAHDKEFMVKGKGYHQLGGGVTPGKFHHTFDEQKVPYPRCYDHRAQDLDVWEIMMCRQVCNSWTWHVFEAPPKTVLDIGCGTGSWIVHAAGTWKECQFWGIDLVPTQPDFATLGDRDLKERVEWVHHNFLEGLPFKDEFFDYIHIKRVGLGVPEDKWDFLFEECKRVLKAGGAFELIEEDLFFPGKPKESSELPESVLKTFEDQPKFSTTRDSFTSDATTIGQSDPPSTITTSSTSLSTYISQFYDVLPTPTTNHTSSFSTPPLSEIHAFATDAAKHIAFTNSDQGGGDNDSLSPLPSTTSHPRSITKPTLYVKTFSSAQTGATPAGSAVSLPNSRGHYAPSPSDYTSSTPVLRSAGVAFTKDSPGVRSRTNSSHSRVSAETALTQNGKLVARSELYKIPRNPRDHTILETIYTEMLAARFINTTPLSILQNYLEYHFTDIRTHPPLLFAFPPTALLHSESRYVTDSESESETESESTSDDEEARDAIRPTPKVAKHVASAADMPRSRYRCILGKHDEEPPSDLRFLSFPHLARRQSPYVSFDSSRGIAFSPSTQAQRRSIDGKTHGTLRQSRLPNRTLNIDLKTLNMHLYLRTMDIIGCSEPMWEWVLDHQSQNAKINNRTGIRATDSSGLLKPTQSDYSLDSCASGDTDESVMREIAEMTREEFEVLLTNFELDMQDQASVDYALQEQVNWRVFASPRDHRRKAFDEACKKWDKWVARQERNARRFTYSHHRSKVGENPGHSPQTPRHRYPDGDLLSPTSGAQNGNLDGHSPGAGRQWKSSKQEFPEPIPVPFSSSSLPPHKRLSRAIRVFVAWKPRDSVSLNQAVPSYHGFDTPDAL